MFEENPDIDQVYQIRAGKYRRYSSLPLKERLTDVKTPLLNARDAFRTVAGYQQARRLLKRLKPDAILIKGGFVAVPVGLAASKLGIPFLTHDSDSTPGLANRIVGRWATWHATGMPAELYAYPKDKTFYTGIPISSQFVKVTPELRADARARLNMADCGHVVTVVGGSQGGTQLNEDIISIVPRLMDKYPDLGIAHISGPAHQAEVETAYREALKPEQLKHVAIRGFVNDMHVYSASANVVVTRASATALSELAVQALPVILVPGRLADGHQEKNAAAFMERGAALSVSYGDAEGLMAAIDNLLSNQEQREKLAVNLHELAKPDAAKELAHLTLKLASERG